MKWKEFWYIFRQCFFYWQNAVGIYLLCAKYFNVLTQSFVVTKCSISCHAIHSVQQTSQVAVGAPNIPGFSKNFRHWMSQCKWKNCDAHRKVVPWNSDLEIWEKTFWPWLFHSLRRVGVMRNLPSGVNAAAIMQINMGGPEHLCMRMSPSRPQKKWV